VFGPGRFGRVLVVIGLILGLVFTSGKVDPKQTEIANAQEMVRLLKELEVDFSRETWEELIEFFDSLCSKLDQ
jgi:hypothetical protein